MKFTKDRYFIDSNVLIYANDHSNPEKLKRAREIITHAFSTRLGCLSTQILQEFFVVVTRKAGIPATNARAQILKLLELDTVIVETDIILGAVDIHIIHQLSFGDALLVKSASSAGCKILYSEDLSHGQRVDGVRIHNPFLDL